MGKTKLTTFKEIINGADLENTLHVLVQDADLRFPVGVYDKLCEEKGCLSNCVRTYCKSAHRTWPCSRHRATELGAHHHERGGPLHSQGKCKL